MAQTTTKQQTLSGSTPDYHRPQPLKGMAYNQSQSDTRGIHTLTTKNTHSQGQACQPFSWGKQGVYKSKKKSKPKSHPLSTKGKSNSKDTWQGHQLLVHVATQLGSNFIIIYSQLATVYNNPLAISCIFSYLLAQFITLKIKCK